MSLVTPIAQSVPAFDAKNENIFKFVSKGGNQVVANRLIVRVNDTNKEIYNKKISAYRFEHKLPSNILTNGIYYNFYFKTYDVNDNESLASNVIPFRCYDTPLIEITNIPINGIVDSSSFKINIKYDQKQKELLNYARVLLFDQYDNKIFQSENIYKTSIPPFEFSYNLVGLEDDTTYHIAIKIETENNTVIESERYSFTTRYYTPSLSSLLELKNNCKDGYVQIKNNFYIVDSESNPEDIGTNPRYLHDGKIYLLEDGYYVKWLKGFSIDKDFTLKYFMENPKEGLLSVLGKDNKRMEIRLIKDYPYNKYCLELTVYDKLPIPYIIYSNYVEDISKIMIWVRRINNLYEIVLYSYTENK